MWIVRLALRRPYTFVVAAILILILGVVSILRTPTDIFPNIDIPVVSVLWTYNGLSPEEMSGRIVYQYERALTTTVNDIEHIESQCWNGRAIVKIFLQPGANIADRRRAGHFDFECRHPQHASWNYTAAGLAVQRILCAHLAAGAFRCGFDRTAAGGSGHELSADLSGNHPWRCCSQPLRRQAAASGSGPEPSGAAIEGPGAARRGECPQRSKPDSSRRHRKDRIVRIPGGYERSDADRGRTQRHADQVDWEFHDLHQGCRLRPRWLSATDQYRACGRAALRADGHSEKRQRFHPGHYFGNQSRPCRRSRRDFRKV